MTTEKKTEEHYVEFVFYLWMNLAIDFLCI